MAREEGVGGGRGGGWRWEEAWEGSAGRVALGRCRWVAVLRRASCSVNSPSKVKSGTRTAPPPMPAAEASTVAAKTAMPQLMSFCPMGKSPSFSTPLASSSTGRVRNRG